jgi:hypothetical protein
LDDPSQPNKKKNQPTWTERAVPETVRPGKTRPLTPEEARDLVPAADPIVKAAYGRTGALPVRPIMNRGDQAADALVIQKGAKQTRVLGFEVEGVHWRAGFAPDVGATPLNQYMPSPLPPDHPIQTGNGFQMRPVEAELEAVLRDLVPAKLLQVGEQMYGPMRELAGVYLYYIPQPVGATVGVLAWYLPSPMGKPHLLYLQTDIKKADPRVIDDMHKTFRASLVARQQQGPSHRPFDFWQELQMATSQVEATLKNSTIARSSADVKGRMSAARHQAENQLYHGVNRGLSSAGELLTFLFIQLPQVALAAAIRGGSKAIIAVITLVDGLLAPRNRNQDGP